MHEPIDMQPETIRTPQELLADMYAEQAKDRKPRRTACRCEIVVDPFGTGDNWLIERDCEHPEDCPHE